jgi:NAD(P)-dependent dehydrogenase (short-subunit alcohol dehydrogenase family)
MGRLSDKRALITGGTSGIGLATAKLFIAEGARVAITGQDATRLEAARAELGDAVIAIRADSADPSSAANAMAEVQSAFGGLDTVFLNAGIAKFAPLADVTEAFFDEQFTINTKSVLFMIQHAVPLLSDGGSIVINTSVNAHMGMAGTLVYAASKAAAASMVRVLAGELAPRNIRVNAVSPGPVETPIYGKLGLPQEDLQAVASGLQAKIPLNRFGQPDEIARVALFLASSDSSFITGAEITADGGWTGVMA